MPVTMEWESRLGRRLRVRDLYILSIVIKSGSMAKAAKLLSMSQPAVSEAIANLEHILGVRLLDRAPHGVTPTPYSDALLKRSITIFDEMMESVRDIEFLADPAMGRVTVGAPESVATTLLPLVAQRFGEMYPRVLLQVEDVPSPAISSPGLRERRVDLLFARWPTPDTTHAAMGDLNIEQLFDDPVVVAAGTHTRWAHRHVVPVEELVEEWWVMSRPGTWNYEWVARAFKERGLGQPKLRIATHNAHLNAHFLKNGPFLTSYPRSWAVLCGFKIVPVEIPLQPMPLSIITLKNRTLSPAVARFIDCVREVAKLFPAQRKSRPPRSKTEVS
jgi:DNA-binding transcriptional LysR family regulator